MLLSNASRAETLRTFDQLSRRLGSTSSRLTVITVATTPDKPRRRSGHASSGSTSSSDSSNSSRGYGPSSRKTPTPRRDAGEDKTTDRREKKSKSSLTPPPKTQHHQHEPHPGKNQPGSADAVPPLRGRTPARQSPAVPNRLSLASIATDSTKLGEIPERKWMSRHTRRRNSDSTMDESDYYNVAPVFPLKPYETPVKERRFFGLFRRRS